MPEGDTLHKAAMRIRPVLEGQVLEEFWARKLRGLRPRVGQRIEAVRAEGKHLLVEFDRELSLDVHLGMSGSWRAYPAGADAGRALRSPQLRVHVATAAGRALCFAAPTVQTFVRTADITPVSHLGVDLTAIGLGSGRPLPLPAPEPSAPTGQRTTRPREGSAGPLADVVARARARHPGGAEIHDVLLDQSVASGIGNVFKSEVLHHERVWPFARLDSLDDATVLRLYETASRLLGANAQSAQGARSTTPHGGSFVYERWRKPCLRCATPIRRAYRGVTRRSTYWCPTCQPES